jgi:hypothetical protein
VTHTQQHAGKHGPQVWRVCEGHVEEGGGEEEGKYDVLESAISVVKGRRDKFLTTVIHVSVLRSSPCEMAVLACMFTVSVCERLETVRS